MASTGSVTEGLNEPSCTPGAASANGDSSFEGLLGTVMYDREAADDFNVPANGWQSNRVSISAVQSTPGDPNAVTGAEIRFLQSNGGSVGALLATATVNTVTRSTGPGTYFGRPEQILAFDINSVALPAGSYFIQVRPQVNHNWFWLTSTPTTPVAGSAVPIQRGILTTPANDATGRAPGWPPDRPTRSSRPPTTSTSRSRASFPPPARWPCSDSAASSPPAVAAPESDCCFES